MAFTNILSDWTPEEQQGATAFIKGNLNNPLAVAQKAQELGLNADTLAQAVNKFGGFGGTFTGQNVEDFARGNNVSLPGMGTATDKQTSSPFAQHVSMWGEDDRKAATNFLETNKNDYDTVVRRAAQEGTNPWDLSVAANSVWGTKFSAQDVANYAGQRGLQLPGMIPQSPKPVTTADPKINNLPNLIDPNSVQRRVTSQDDFINGELKQRGIFQGEDKQWMVRGDEGARRLGEDELGGDPISALRSIYDSKRGSFELTGDPLAGQYVRPDGGFYIGGNVGLLRTGYSGLYAGQSGQSFTNPNGSAEYNKYLADFDAKYNGYSQLDPSHVRYDPATQRISLVGMDENDPRNSRQYISDPSQIIYDPNYGLIAPNNTFGAAGSHDEGALKSGAWAPLLPLMAWAAPTAIAAMAPELATAGSAAAALTTGIAPTLTTTGLVGAGALSGAVVNGARTGSLEGAATGAVTGALGAYGSTFLPQIADAAGFGDALKSFQTGAAPGLNFEGAPPSFGGDAVASGFGNPELVSTFDDGVQVASNDLEDGFVPDNETFPSVDLTGDGAYNQPGGYSVDPGYQSPLQRLALPDSGNPMTPGTFSAPQIGNTFVDNSAVQSLFDNFVDPYASPRTAEQDKVGDEHDYVGSTANGGAGMPDFFKIASLGALAAGATGGFTNILGGSAHSDTNINTTLNPTHVPPPTLTTMPSLFDDAPPPAPPVVVQPQAAPTSGDLGFQYLWRTRDRNNGKSLYNPIDARTATIRDSARATGWHNLIRF